LPSTHKGLTVTNVPIDEEIVFWSGGGDNESGGGIEDCDFDSGGVGQSSVPISNSDHQGFLHFYSYVFIRLFCLFVLDCLFEWYIVWVPL